MKSAYAQAEGKEPDFTNFAQVTENPVLIDTLDYLFFSEGGLQVEEVLTLPQRDQVVGPLPNDNEPSDHLLTAACFSFRTDSP